MTLDEQEQPLWPASVAAARVAKRAVVQQLATDRPTLPAVPARAADRAVAGGALPEADALVAQRRFLIACAITLLVLCGLSITLGENVLPRVARAKVIDIALIPIAGSVALACGWTASRSRGRLRIAWGLLATAGMLWALGELAWVLTEPTLPGIRHHPSIADLFRLAAFPAAAVALPHFPSPRRTGTDRIRILLGGLIASLSVLFLSRALALMVIVPAASGSWLNRVMFITYPIANIVVGSLGLWALVKAGAAARLPLVLVVAGILIYCVADTGYTYSVADGGYQGGGMLEVGWAAAYLLLTLGALAPGAEIPSDRLPEPAAELVSLSSSLVVYVPLFTAIAVVFAHPGQARDPVLAVTGLCLAVLFGVRQGLLAADNASLRKDLERQVSRLESRTTELNRLAIQQRRILESVVDGVFGVDSDGTIGFANAAAIRMLGRSLSELKGISVQTLLEAPVDGERGRGAELILDALRSGTPTATEDEGFVRGDGTTFPVELAVGPIVGDGSTGGAVVVFRDISERRRIETMKDDFVSVVSHELRTPLTSIRGSLGLLAGGASGSLPAPAVRMITIALESSERLGRLINEMLDIERIESGSSAMSFNEASAKALIEVAIDGIRGMAEEHRVVLVTGPAQGRVHVDRDRIVQALTNLIGNAIKFSPIGSTVFVSARRVGHEIVFEVVDHGRGIPKDKLESVFNRFQQVDKSDSREKGGTGLGLAITRSIVQRHGGRIWVTSTLGIGSVFRFTVPAIGPADASDSRPPSPFVLVADDDPEEREELLTRLGERGYATEAAGSAAEAALQALIKQPDVILLSLHTGRREWLRWLDEQSVIRAIPVVVRSDTSPVADELAGSATGWVHAHAGYTALSRSVGQAMSVRKTQPTVLVISDHPQLADAICEGVERRGLFVTRAGGKHAGVCLTHDLQPAAIVLDFDLLNGAGFEVVEDLRADERSARTPLVVYASEEVPDDQRAKLSLGDTVFLIKEKLSHDRLADEVLRLVGVPVV